MTVFKPAELFRRLRDGHTLITGNSRLAGVLANRYADWRAAAGDRQWPRAAILSWNAWLDRLWQDAALAGVTGTDRAIPGEQQVLSLWSVVLDRSDLAAGLLRPRALARQVRDSRRLAVEWGVDFDAAAWRAGVAGNENHAAFAQWNRAFETRCAKHGWLPPEDRATVLARAAAAGERLVRAPVDLLGFDELSPQQRALFDALDAGGAPVTLAELAPSGGGAVLWRSASEREELDVMARWVRHRLERDPETTIAIVAPDLAESRTTIERHLQRILAPADTPPHRAERPWNVSMGQPLDRVAPVASAFDLLALLGDRIDIQTVGRVLRSPWIRGGARERGPRAHLERFLRDTYPRQLKLDELAYQARAIRRHARDGSELPAEEQQPRPWNAPLLAALTDSLQRFDRESRKPRRPSAWAEAFERLLNAAGWPRTPDSGPADEHDAAWQAWQAWRDALRALASLDATGDRISRDAALGQLRQICRERVFQPRSAPARVQVLGLYEVTGLRFDHLWVTGLHGDNWPGAARPDPFIPGALQVAAGLPHSSPRRELDVARTVTRRLLESATEIVFSYPGQHAGEPVLASPLLANLPRAADDDLARWTEPDWPGLMANARGTVLDPLTMPGPLTGSTARGGSSILKHQALCPFRAFARNRLGAEGLEDPADGISPMLHGSLLHRVLEGFWRETRSQARLLTLAPGERRRRIADHVERVLAEERGLRFRPQFRDVEARRLQRLAQDALELELERSEFEAVDFEREVLHEIGGQTIRLYIDRVDRLADGGLAIIDYKTGRVDPAKWFGERPEDPQLPLYAISAGETPFAVVFAVIRDDERLFKGVVRAEGAFPGLPPRRTRASEALVAAGADMAQTVADWRAVLHGLMAAFLSGQAAVDPKDGRNTCSGSWCELQSLCRIDELERLQSDDAAEGMA
ncbi:MAG: PD-(D/E)XK nuclease family protein [Xanthomonadales bacterium]